MSDFPHRRLTDSPEVMNDLYSRLGRIEANTEQLIDRHNQIDSRFGRVESRMNKVEKAEMKLIGIAIGAYALTGLLLKMGLL